MYRPSLYFVFLDYVLEKLNHFFPVDHVIQVFVDALNKLSSLDAVGKPFLPHAFESVVEKSRYLAVF